MNEPARRFFSGSTLTQALAAAARWYAVPPDELAYVVRDKRHGFLKAARAVVIEVDPAAPRRPASAEPTPRSAAPAAHATAPAAQTAAPAARPLPGQPPAVRPPATATPRREGAEPEAWQSPDAEAEVAAAEAMLRLLRLAGLDLEARVVRGADRLEIALGGADEARLGALGLAFLDHLEHLLPRAVHGLCGKLVRVRLEGADLRGARERQLRGLARAAAERVLASGCDELLDALEPGERRVVHLELADCAGIATESQGSGHRKRVRISPSR